MEASTPDETGASDKDKRNGLQARVEAVLLGGERKYNRLEVAERAGVSPDRTSMLWRALGFAGAADDDVVFTDADVEAAQIANGFLESGLIDEKTDTAMTRALGHHLSRLAEWQVQLVTSWLEQRPDVAESEEQFAQLVEASVPAIERLQNYVWRRHLAAFSGRALATDAQLETRSQAVGFVDMVGYTRMTRRVDRDQLSTLLERFEGLATGVIAEHHGHIVKMIGDEVLFVCDSPVEAAEIALTLTEQTEADDDIPEVRAGLAYGRILSRFGDVYGSVVNMAARLTSAARPGTVLVDKELADALSGREEFALRGKRPISVRGYKRLKPMVLRRA